MATFDKGLNLFPKGKAREQFQAITRKSIHGKILEALRTSVQDTIEKIALSAPIYDPDQGHLMMWNMRNVSLRLMTVRMLLEGLEKASRIGEQRFRNELRSIGWNIGTSFARDFVNVIREEPLPPYHEDLLEMWCYYDSKAGWGIINVLAYSDNEAEIEIDESFVAFDRGDSMDHRYCSFMSGYICGVVWELFGLWEYLLEKGREEITVNRIKPVNVKHSGLHRKCLFHIELAPLLLTESRHLLTEAFMHLEQSLLDDAKTEARAVLEYALKERLGLNPKATYIPFRTLESAYKRGGAELPYRALERLYYSLSDSPHRQKITPVKDTPTLMSDVDKCLYEIEALSPQLENSIRSELDMLQ